MKKTKEEWIQLKRKQIEGSRGKEKKSKVDCQEEGGEEKLKEMEEEARREMTKRLWRKSEMLKEIP